MRMTLTSAAILSALAFPPLIEAAPTAPVRQGPKAIDPAENGIGRWIPDVEFISVKGKRGRLSDFKSGKALVVAFTGASCPVSKRFAPTLAALEKDPECASRRRPGQVLRRRSHDPDVVVARAAAAAATVLHVIVGRERPGFGRVRCQQAGRGGAAHDRRFVKVRRVGGVGDRTRLDCKPDRDCEDEDSHR